MIYSEIMFWLGVSLIALSSVFAILTGYFIFIFDKKDIISWFMVFMFLIILSIIIFVGFDVMKFSQKLI